MIRMNESFGQRVDCDQNAWHKD